MSSSPFHLQYPPLQPRKQEVVPSGVKLPAAKMDKATTKRHSRKEEELSLEGAGVPLSTGIPFWRLKFTGMILPVKTLQEKMRSRISLGKIKATTQGQENPNPTFGVIFAFWDDFCRLATMRKNKA